MTADVQVLIARLTIGAEKAKADCADKVSTERGPRPLSDLIISANRFKDMGLMSDAAYPLPAAPAPR